MSLAKRLSVGVDLKFKGSVDNIIAQKNLFKKYKNILDKNLYYERRLINFLTQYSHIKGRKFIFHLPVRGQRTHTNGRTAKKVIIGK